MDRNKKQLKIADRKEFDELITSASGSIGKALSYLEENTWASEHKVRKNVKRFIECAVSGADAYEILSAVSAFYVSRDALGDLLNLTLNAIRDLIFAKESDDFSLVFYSSKDEAIELCDKVSLTFLYSLQDAVSNALDECKRNANLKLLILKMLISVNLI